MRLLITIFTFFISIYSQSQTIITNTTVVDVENKKLIPNQNVLIENDKISNIGSKIKTPQNAKTIDGTGKYLMPGFVDAHVHFFQSGSMYARPDAIDLRKYKSYENEVAWVHNNMESFLRRYLKAGITSVIDVGSTVSFLKQRDSFQNKSYAPSVYMTGPLLTTWQPPVYKGLKDDEPFYEMKTVEEARKYVQTQLPFKPDFIKIWYIVQGRNKDSAARVHLPLVQAVIDEAHKNNLRVAVHATERITAQLAVEAGADLLVHGIENEPVSIEFVKLLQRKKVVMSPTLVVSNGYRNAFGQEYQLDDEDFHYAHPTPLNSLIDFKHLPDTTLRKNYKAYVQRTVATAKSDDSLLRANTKKLLDGGVIIATGTDAGNIGTQHVSSYFDELRALQQTGLNMWQIIQSSTINGAKAMGMDAQFGSIKKGKRADMILLNKNPLDGIDNWKSIELVINKGSIIDPDSIVNYSPVDLIETQALAYNAHKLNYFLFPYADDVEVFTIPNESSRVKGIEAFKKNYEFLNNAPDLYFRVINRMVHKNVVIDHEEVTFDKNRKPVYAIATYYIEGGKIRKVYFAQ
jgi:imidazolonepropionase-like amidohydrolase